MFNKILRWLKTLNYPSYVIFFVTANCNAKCKMCFYQDNMAENRGQHELTVAEYDEISQKIKSINILGISGGEPFFRNDLAKIIKVIYKNRRPLVVDLPTNGFFTESILRQAEDIAKNCPEMIVDLQLSIDGPEKIHNEIRGLKDGFARMKETYEGLVNLKNKYKNLRVKACVVYSHYNEGRIEELFDILDKDFKDLDRIVFSVVHGSVSNAEAFRFDWNKYFAICEKIQRKFVVKNPGDFHSIFTMALRIVKNDFLKKALKMGHKIIVIINKIDKKGARPDYALNATMDLFLDLGAGENSLNFPVVYASGKEGKAGKDADISKMKDIFPVFEEIMKHIPAPLGDPEEPLQQKRS